MNRDITKRRLCTAYIYYMIIKIIIAVHKPYWMPDDSVYLPLHVGAEGKSDLGYTKDNTGENISAKNPNF